MEVARREDGRVLRWGNKVKGSYMFFRVTEKCVGERKEQGERQGEGVSAAELHVS